jgi:flagellar biosynthesis protein FliR
VRDALLDAFWEHNENLRLGLAWARVVPSIVLVPAFGLKSVPIAVRLGLSVVLAVTVLPMVPPAPFQGGAWLVEALGQFALGVPLAIAAAVPLWAASMAGGLVDTGRFGTLLGMLASAFFLADGGPAHLAEVLVALPPVNAVENLVAGIRMAVALAAPVVAATVVVNVGAALMERAAWPVSVASVGASLRAVVVLGLLGMVFERVAMAMRGSFGR